MYQREEKSLIVIRILALVIIVVVFFILLYLPFVFEGEFNIFQGEFNVFQFISEKLFLGIDDDKIFLAPPTTCGTITIGGTYALTGPVSSTSTCFVVNADNVVIDCVNKEANTITYGTSAGTTSRGIEVVGRNNVIIKNCKIIKQGVPEELGSSGIYFENNGGTARSITIDNVYTRSGKFNLIVKRSGTQSATAKAINSDFEISSQVLVESSTAQNALSKLTLTNSVPADGSVYSSCSIGAQCPTQLVISRYFQTKVQDDGNPVSNVASVTVDIKDRTGAIIYNDLITDSSGLTSIVEVIEKTKSASTGGSTPTTDDRNPHTIDAIKINYISSLGNSVNVNTNNQLATITLPVNTNVNSCRSLDTNGKTYTITSPLSSSSGECIVINAGSIFLEGNGNTITLTDGFGVKINSVTNPDIKNLNIVGSGIGVGFYITGTDGFNIENVDANNLLTGVLVGGTAVGNIKNSITSGSDSDIQFIPSSFNSVVNLYSPDLGATEVIRYDTNAVGTVNKYWYVDLHLQQENGISVGGAGLSAVANDPSLTTTNLGITDSSGNLLGEFLLEYVRKETGTTIHTPYRFDLISHPSIIPQTGTTADSNVNGDRIGGDNIIIEVDGANPNLIFLDSSTGGNPANEIGQTPLAGFHPNSLLMINTSITEKNLKTVTFKWNGVDKNVFDSFTKLLLNMDNTGINGDTSPTIKDMSGNGNDGTATGATTIVNGKYRGAYNFAGSVDANNNRISLGTPASLNFGLNTDKSYTIVAWINPRGFGQGASGNFGKIVDKSAGASNAGSGGYTFYIRDQENDLGAGHGTAVNSPTNNIISLDTWQQVAIVYSQNPTSKITFYVDGSNKGSAILTADTTPDSDNYPIYIGNNNGLNRDFDGLIDEVMMFDKALTDSDIQQLYISNLYKFNVDKWRLNVQQNLLNGVYQFQTIGEDKAGNLCSAITCRTDLRTVTISSVLPVSTFQAPTPANGDSVASQFSMLTDIVVQDLGKVTFKWNGVGSDVFDSSTKLLMNLDNVALLGESATVVKDMSGNGNDGTATGATTIVNGKYRGAYNFAGSVDANNNRINLGARRSLNFGANADKSYTISAWINPRSAGINNFGRIVDKSTGISAGGGYSFYLRSPGTQLTLNNDGTSVDSSAGASLLNKWSHVVAVFNYINDATTTYAFYVDGVLAGSGDFPNDKIPGKNTAHPIVIGSNQDLTRDFDGYIDEVIMWDRALTLSEVQQLYISNLYKYDVGKWKLFVEKKNLVEGSYTFQTLASDRVGNLCSGNPCGTESRTVSVDTTSPTLVFQAPTPANNDPISIEPLKIETIITERNLKTVTFNWNGAPYNIFDSSTKLLMNLDNVALLGESATVVKDMSGNGNDGSVFEAGVLASGKYGKAFNFDGVNDRITIVGSNSLNFGANADKSYTISAWINPRSLGGGGLGRIVDSSNANTEGTNGYTIYVKDAGAGMNKIVVANNGVAVESSSLDSLLNKWSYVSVIYNQVAGTATFYLNGLNVGTTNIGGPGVNTGLVNPILIGNRNGNDRGFDGYIDEVMMWDRVLTLNEVQQLYYSNLFKYGVDKWRLNVDQKGSINGVKTFQVFAEDKAGNKCSGVTCTSGLRTITVNINLVVSSLSNVPANVFIQPATSKPITFKSTVKNYGDFSRIGNVRGSFTATPPLDGTVRTDADFCSFIRINPDDLNKYEYSCVVDIWYYDEPGTWTVKSAVLDSSNSQWSVDTTATFALASEKYLTNDPSINFGSLAPGNNLNIKKTLQIKNVGNTDINCIKLKGKNLIGETNPASNIGVNNFAAHSAVFDASCTLGTLLVHDTELSFSGFNINRGDNSQGQGLGSLYFCLKQIPIGLPIQAYSAKNPNPWEITYPVDETTDPQGSCT
ncbi:MAG: LamG domain-containing protein [Nanoarchaeota archaeon]|nr:LamG domain-containing protein [Nanoarchaeota archaeon]